MLVAARHTAKQAVWWAQMRSLGGKGSKTIRFLQKTILYSALSMTSMCPLKWLAVEVCAVIQLFADMLTLPVAVSGTANAAVLLAEGHLLGRRLKDFETAITFNHSAGCQHS